MKISTTLLCICCTLAAIVSANSKWTEFPYFGDTKLVMAVTATGPTEAFVAGSDDRYNDWRDICRAVYTDDAGNTFRALETPDDHSTMFHLGIAYTNRTHGASTGVSLLSTAHKYVDDGQKLKNPSTELLMTQSQSLEKVAGRPLTYGATGQFGDDHGVHMTSDGGITWQFYDWQYTKTNPRYSSFPSSRVWYVAGGRWPKSGKSALHYGFLAEELQLSVDKSDNRFEMNLNIFAMGALPGRPGLDGYEAVIQKTEDGGQTFTTVFESTGVDTGYFNQISCPSENVCFAVAEGRGNCRIFHTSDGGQNWEKQLESAGNLMAIDCVSETECFAGGRYDMEGRFYHTVDGGKTWTPTDIPGLMIMDISMYDSAHGFATAGALFRGDSSLLVFQPAE